MLRSSAGYHEFIQTPRLGATTVDSSAMAAWKVGTRFSVEGSATHVYSPYFQFHPALLAQPYVPGVIPPVAPYIAGLVESDTVNVWAGFTSLYSKRATFSASVSRGQTDFRDLSEGDFETSGARATWTRRMTRDVGVRLGYAREVSRSESLGNVEYVNEAIEAGVDLARALSLSRRTTFAFQTESSLIGRNGESRHFRLNGGVQLTRWFSRTWHAGVHANRATEFMAGFVEPLFSDMAGGSVGGMLSTRSQLVLSLNGGRGYFGTEGQLGRFTTGSATAQLGFALSDRVGLFAQHAFFYYQMPPGVSSLSAVHRLSRQAFTVTAAVWLPVINRERSPSDSR
jgi:hypothetical protein